MSPQVMASTPTGAQSSTSAFFAQRFTPTRRVDSWIKSRTEEKQREKNRKIINGYLRLLGTANRGRGGGLSLNREGACLFTYKKFVVAIVVPHEDSKICLFSTKVCHLVPNTVKRTAIMEASLLLHDKSCNPADGSEELAPHYETSPQTGCMTCLTVPVRLLHPVEQVLSLTIPAVGDSAELSLKLPIKGLSYEEMVECMDAFIHSAVDVNRKLEMVARA
jgi:hypothetical protein